MRLRIYDPRILALDLRLRRFGFAVFEGPRGLLDYGVRSIASQEGHGHRFASKPLSELIRIWAPESIVIKKEKWEALGAKPETKALSANILELISTHEILLRLVSRHDFEVAFDHLGSTTKYEIAASLGRIFPELAWKVPPERKPWESEHPRMSAFDAIALGLASWQHESIEVLPTRPSIDDEIQID